MSERYDDIIHLPHHKSEIRKQMSILDRAAQFAPFAALTGYDAAVRETARLTEKRIEPDEDAVAEINRKLRQLYEEMADEPMVSVTYFRPDEKKSGGAYVTVTGRVKKIDPVSQRVVMEDEREIPMGEILSIEEE